MEQLVPVELYYLERDENPGFEAKCDVYGGFGASAGEALDALAQSIEAGPPKPAAPTAELVEATSTSPSEPTPIGATVDYDVLADKLFARFKADEQATTTEPPAPAAS